MSIEILKRQQELREAQRKSEEIRRRSEMITLASSLGIQLIINSQSRLFNMALNPNLSADNLKELSEKMAEHQKFLLDKMIEKVTHQFEDC